MADDPAAVLAILDIDGTLVDTNYHHSLAWYRAFRQHGIALAIWQIHRHIGMGGDQLVRSLTDEGTEHAHGDAIRRGEAVLYCELIDEVQTMARSRELIEELRRRGHAVVLASSAKAAEVDHYLDLLDARELAQAWTTSADVEATKPEPDLVRAALHQGAASSERAVMIGDTPWDVESAKRAGVPTIAVMTGGFSEQELRDAGAAAVFESVGELLDGLDSTALN